MVSTFIRQRANALHEEGVALSDAGDDDGALAQYAAALALDAERPDTLYDIGLIYKYRSDWLQSAEFNRRAYALRPDDEATRWNLAIAATALRDWRTARQMWRELAILTDAGEGPIELSLGTTPVRLNAEENNEAPTEVVWARRLCPVRARILNIPTGETGFRYGDVVLHDGAPMGHRLDADGNERAVFNVLELFEPSAFATYEATVHAASASEVAALEALCDAALCPFEDWTASMRYLCRACSEGRPHEQHDHELPAPTTWQVERRVAIAATDAHKLTPIFDQWLQTSGRRVGDWRCVLAAGSGS